MSGLVEIRRILSIFLVPSASEQLAACDTHADGETLDSPALTKDQKMRVHYMRTAGENVADRVTLIKD